MAFLKSSFSLQKRPARLKESFCSSRGNKLKRKTKAKVRALGIKQHTGNYNKHIKRGKVWTEANANTMSVRVYSKCAACTLD